MNESEMTIPHLFRCPISLDLFTDPVTLCTGQTYDRSSIEKWLSAGNLTCPVTMQKLQDPTLVPNHNLRHLIDQWRQLGQQFDPDYFATINPLVSLKNKLEIPESTLQDKLQSLESIQALMEETPCKSSCVVRFGFLPLLLELVFQEVDPDRISQLYTKVVEQGLACVLRLLPVGELQCLNMLKEESKLESFVVLFEHGTSVIKQSLCDLVVAICSCSETMEVSAMIGRNPRFLRRILSLLHHQNFETSEAGMRSISALCCLESNREKLVQQGVINGLITFILNSERKERSLAAMAMARIEQLLAMETAKEALIHNQNGIQALVKMVFRVSDHEGSESAVNSLMLVCHESIEAKEKAIVNGVLTQLLLLLQSQCSGRTKIKARALMKLLRSK